jgi:DNA primase
MNNIEEIKDVLKPVEVAKYYIGEPEKENATGLWYKSPFRNEKTASFLVNNTKGIHDFGTSKHYDIVDFVKELFNVDLKTAINKLSCDFGINIKNSETIKFKEYLIRKREEEIEMKKELNKWFNSTYIKLCEELKMWEKMIPHLKKEALVIAYKYQMHIEYWIEVFVSVKENEKAELWKIRNEIKKYIK